MHCETHSPFYTQGRCSKLGSYKYIYLISINILLFKNQRYKWVLITLITHIIHSFFMLSNMYFSLFRLQSEQLDQVYLEMKTRSLKRSIFMTTDNLMTKDIMKIGIIQLCESFTIFSSYINLLVYLILMSFNIFCIARQPYKNSSHCLV